MRIEDIRYGFFLKKGIYFSKIFFLFKKELFFLIELNLMLGWERNYM